jgi:MFS family permease
MAADSTPRSAHRKVIVAAGLGALFEWYDFYLYGALAAILAQQFLATLEPRAALTFALFGFAAGFIVRPLGALLFGRLGDLIGRKYTFLVTLLLMGAATFVVGVLPGHAPPSARRHRWHWWCCACCRAWRSAASTAAW